MSASFAIAAFLSANAHNVFRRNLLAWRKYAWSSITINLAEPFFYFLAIGFGLGTYVRLGGGASFVHFLAAGLLAATPMNVATFDGCWGVYERLNTSGVYESMVTAPVEPSDIVAGECLWQAFRSLVYGALFMIVMAGFGLVHSWWAILALPVAAFTGLLFAVPALSVAMAVPYVEQLFYYFSLVITPLFTVSGVFFPLDRMPGWAIGALWCTPLYHAVNVIRALVDGRPTPGTAGDALWMIVFVALLLPLPIRLVTRKLAAR